MAYNFPNSAVNGDVYLDYTFVDGAWSKTQPQYGGLPCGAIIPWAGATAPVNYLLCDGSAVSRTTYSSLFAVVGTTYGAGNGSTTFNVPDLRGRVPVGKNGGSFGTLGATGGAETHTLSVTEMPSHTHVQDAHSHGGVIITGGLSVPNGNYYGVWGNYGLKNTDNATATNQYTGGSQAHNNVQPYQVINYIIKTTVAITPGDSELAPRVAAVETGKANLSGATFTGTIIGKTNTGGSLATSYDSGSFSARGDSTNSAVISFHRPGYFAVNIGVETDNTFKIGGWSMPAGSLSIDGSGRVVTPNQTAFLCYSATGTASKSGGSWGNISTFPTSGGAATAVASYNIGNNWNSSNGRFTAPTAGRYVFQVGGWGNYNGAGNRYAYCFQKNGGAYNFIGGGGTTAADSPMAGYSAILDLAAGDYVDLHMFSAVTLGLGSPSHYIWWGGYLLG